MTRARSIQAGLSVLFIIGGLSCRQAPRPESGSETVATVAGKAISRAELEVRVKADHQASLRLLDVENERFDIFDGALEDMINQSLFESEAKRRGVKVDELLAAEVDAKIAPVTDAEKRAQYEGIKARVKDRPEADVLRQIESNMREQRRAERRDAFASELWKKANVAVTLDAPRREVEAGNGPALGPANAPVTIVEFSDFQCPYCSRGAALIKQVHKQYGDRVRLVFRHFPLKQIHPYAAKAAEAANCAAAQGRFWEMHDRLFEKQAELEPAALKRYATDLGLDGKAFAKCLDSGTEALAVQRDQTAGEELGVRGTPAFFVNGRMVKGALPIDRFARVIDRELARAQPSATPAAR
jgi:protein-disulfide isomerase